MTSKTDVRTAITETAPDVIVIENLTVPAEIGLLDSEKGRTQLITVNVEIQTVPGYRAVVKDTGAFISYADTVVFIKDKAEHGGHVDLVEDWAEAVAEFVLQNPLADHVTVTLSKLEIFDEADGVGIRISRKRVQAVLPADARGLFEG